MDSEMKPIWKGISYTLMRFNLRLNVSQLNLDLFQGVGIGRHVLRRGQLNLQSRDELG